MRCLLILAFAVLWAIAAAGVNRADEPARAAAPTHTNRLAKESSPYLLLHAHNPVDWYPWGEEALAKARAEKKPIFLSVGYSSCYWCHVMERESFTDEEIAAALNKNFVCIKVDREERPDIDEIYMQALHVYLQLVGSKQGGGWPLSMFLTPDAKPLVGGTYFPPRDKDGRAGFLTVLGTVTEAWAKDSEKWQKAADALSEYVAESLKQRPILKPVKLDKALIDGVLRALIDQYDGEYGGFGFDPANPRQSKFPEPPNLVFLIDMARLHQSLTAKKMVVQTLEKISQGGIRDHIGGGFHRYSTDRFWRVPHFEKMLYDNGQLVTVFSQAYQVWPREDFKRAVDETIEFVLRELTDGAGGFYTALDAETHGREGRYYVWDRAEVQKLLSSDEFELWSEVYSLAGEPNFEAHYVPQLARSLADEAKRRKLDEVALDARLQPIRRKLLTERAKRTRPLCDTKILCGWNGLMIRGLAEAGVTFKIDRYTAAAVRAANFVLTNMRDSNGRLQRSYAGGQATLLGYLDDYAFFIDGLIALHRATGDQRWLDVAHQLTEQELSLFWDERVGGFFYTSSEHETLLARSKVPTDNVTPSGNSVSAANLLYLAKALDDPGYVARAEKCFRVAGPIFEEHPSAVPQLAAALSTWLEMPANRGRKAAKQ